MNELSFHPIDTLHIVRDGRYGFPPTLSEDDDWDGIVGELVRKEVDMAIAPLTITSMREQVIDFTKPFMTSGISIMMKKPLRDPSGVFNFMYPLSEEIWICAICACVGVSIVLFLVSRFSPYEWKVTETYRKSVVSNDFSMRNSLWFVIASSLHQRSDLFP
ncbi:Glutamate receptor 2, partial [Halocaridina rubra]